jgi:RNA polymerase-binding transcription factor DksA
MDKATLGKLKAKLLERKNKVEEELGSIAKKDDKVKGDYDTRYPDFGTSQSSDEEASEVAAYESTLPIEYALELRLADINKALQKIEKGEYGICENCQEPIDPKRLEIMPEAKLCLKCHKK